MRAQDYRFVILVSNFGDHRLLTRFPITDQFFAEAELSKAVRHFVMQELRHTAGQEFLNKLGSAVRPDAEEWWYGYDLSESSALQRDQRPRRLDW